MNMSDRYKGKMSGLRRDAQTSCFFFKTDRDKDKERRREEYKETEREG